MKKIINLSMLIAVLATFSCALHAQDNKRRMTREQLAEAQAKHIAVAIAMDDATSQKFIETYCQFQQEIWAIGPKVKAKTDREIMTDEESREAMNNHFEHSQKILDIRQKYYGIYSKFLTQKQILRVYELEKQMMNRLHKRGMRKNR